MLWDPNLGTRNLWIRYIFRTGIEIRRTIREGGYRGLHCVKVDNTVFLFFFRNQNK